jgi:hypothetical protein
LEKIFKTDLKKTKNLSETIRGSQRFDSTSLVEILNMTIKSSVQAIKFYPDLSMGTNESTPR